MANEKDTYYFSHDSNARNDEKVLMLRAEHGWEGYGLYWALVEMMFESKDTALYHDKIKGLALSYNTDITLLQSVINTGIKEGLFVSDDNRFWSESLARRKAAFHELREKKSLAGKKGMASRWGTDNTLITPDNKGKESKVKEKKENVTISENIFSDDSLQMKMTKYMIKKIVENYPSAKIPSTPAKLQKWCMSFDRLMRIDGKTKEQIREVMEWIYQDEFWCDQIRSPDKLRDKWDTVFTQMNRRNKQQDNEIKPLEHRYL